MQFMVTNVVTIMIPLWGMIGIWTTKIGCVIISSVESVPSPSLTCP